MHTLIPLAERPQAPQAAQRDDRHRESSTGGLISAALWQCPVRRPTSRRAVVYTARPERCDGHPHEAVRGMRSASELMRCCWRALCNNAMARLGLSETGATGPTGNPYGDAAGHRVWPWLV